MAADKHPLKGFFMQGVPKSDNIANGQYITDCVFCGTSDKFYINVQNKLWDCKVCGAKGNYLQFLEQVHEANKKRITDDELEILAVDRGLPVEAFANEGVGWNGYKYTFGVYDPLGKFIGMRMYKPGFTVMSVSETKVGLIHAQELGDKDRYNEPVWLMEGDWDTYAMAWLLKSTGTKGIVVGVPGANTFKDEWAAYFYDRDVRVCYDHDDPGIKGELKVHGMLQTAVDSIAYLHWPDDKPEGYDIRDQVVYTACTKKLPNKCLKKITSYLQGVPRGLSQLAAQNESGKLVLEGSKPLEPISFQETVAAFQEFLYMKDITPIKVMLATIFANRIDGEMVWIFLVAPPSSAKTELIRSLFSLDIVTPLSSMTANTLHSGFVGTANQDYSLLKDLDGKILAIKDFTGILSMFAAKRDEIFGQLRDAYDGETSKRWGNTKTKFYKAKFGILAGVTDAIEKFSHMHQTLGERFLKYRIPVDRIEEEVMAVMLRGMQNTGHHLEKRKKVADAVKRFIMLHPETKPIVPENIAKKIIYVARYTALMRGFVEKGMQQDILYKPASETPIRLCKQLLQLGIGLACLEQKPEMDIEDFRVLKEVAISTCPQRVEAVVKCLYENFDLPLKLMEISKATDYDPLTIRIILRDLVSLKLVSIETIGRTLIYTLSLPFRVIIDNAEMYAKSVKKRIIFRVAE